ncbi:hypothetical protein AB0D42_25550 [Streptomyces sp. NPDC048304]|uniref:hypothetical protein n=1 Tax=Streptomyces sp. NPDC048304 TaxID=3154820 RepID=UPI00340E0DD1
MYSKRLDPDDPDATGVWDDRHGGWQVTGAYVPRVAGAEGDRRRPALRFGRRTGRDRRAPREGGKGALRRHAPFRRVRGCHAGFHGDVPEERDHRRAGRITVRDTGTRRTAWRDITAIEIEANPVEAGGLAKTVDSVVIYTRDGRRIVLPHLAGSGTLSVHHEVLTLRELWERQRGEDWIPQPTAIEVAKERSAARERTEAAVLGAVGCARTAMRITVFGVIVVGLIALATGRPTTSRSPGGCSPRC